MSPARKVRLFPLFVSASLAFAACGDEESPGKKEVAGAPSADGGGTAGETKAFTGTLVQILAADDSAPILTPHFVELLDGDTGEPFDPPVNGMTSSSTGKITLDIPTDEKFSIHIVGEGSASVATSTYDTVILNVNPDSGDTLLRISSGGTLSLAEGTGGFTAEASAAAVTGAVYWTPGGTARRGAIGCAKVYLDGATAPDEDAAQRYNGSSGLPVPVASLEQTLANSGRFYLGNVAPGEHSVTVSMDDGATFVNTTTFTVPLPRSGAQSEIKAVLYQLGLDVDVAANPTPSGCPAAE